jgi:hypothetical protein
MIPEEQLAQWYISEGQRRRNLAKRAREAAAKAQSPWDQVLALLGEILSMLVDDRYGFEPPPPTTPA